MSTKPIDPLSLCVNANAIADGLDEYAELKAEAIAKPIYLTASADLWRQRMTRWAESEKQAAKTIRELVGAFAQLEAEVERLSKRNRESDDQLVWLADWCRRTIGVENNEVIGRNGWPHRLVEVVAKAVEAEWEPRSL